MREDNQNITIKKLSIILLILTILCFTAKQMIDKIISERYVYVESGPNLKYYHNGRYTSYIKLDDGNILILGNNLYTDKFKQNSLSEIYDVNTNSVKELHFPFENELYFMSNGKLLKNNRLLLTDAYMPNKNEYIEGKAFPYDSMAIINLNNMKIEKIIRKKINETFSPGTNEYYLLFDNNKIYTRQYSETEHKYKAEIIDLENDSSKILNDINLPEDLYNIIPIKRNKLLFITHGYKENSDNYDYVYEYNTDTEQLKKVGKVIKRIFPVVKKINDNEIIIAGGTNENRNKRYNEIEIYNINTNESQVIANLQIERCTTSIDGFNVVKLGENKLLILNGSCSRNEIFPSYSKLDPGRRPEILNMENHNIALGPILKLPYRNYVEAITLDNGNVFVSSGNFIHIYKQKGKSK